MRAFCDLLFDLLKFKKTKILKNPKFMINSFNQERATFNMTMFKDKLLAPKTFEDVMMLISRS